MNIANLIRLYNTVKFLKPIQIYHKIYYVTRGKIRNILNVKTPLIKQSNSIKIKLCDSIHITDNYFGDREFRFLNLSMKFDDDIDWNYAYYGKLWTYNLTYFDFLSKSHQDNLDLIESFVDSIEYVRDGIEPFPISLRGINWIKYFSYNEIKFKHLDDSLYAQYYILLDNLEYHLLGNHLLENAFSLLFGAYYFQDEFLYMKSTKILLEQLEEQVLEDGAHFELSPMYHQIMLYRVLDCINLVKNNNWKDQHLLDFLLSKAASMIGWLKAISYKDDTIPLFNDSANGIAPTSKALYDYAKRLKVVNQTSILKESGYRKILKANYEMLLDVGHIGAEYIPGHVHSDTFTFELKINERHFIVDTGLSTYETCPRRTLERSTSSHNTVEINSKNQSDVWGGFRVANRAKIISLEETKDYIQSTHDGYKEANVYHTRTWNFNEDSVIIDDTIGKGVKGIARLHFHPTVTKEKIESMIDINSKEMTIKTYRYAPEFNKYMDAFVLEVIFISELKTTIVCK